MARKKTQFCWFPGTCGKFPLEDPLAEALGPEKLIIYVKFYVESEFQVENARFLHPDLEHW